MLSEMFDATRNATARLLDVVTWGAARRAVDAVRYRPRRLDLVLAGSVAQADLPPPVARWIADARTWPPVRRAAGLPHGFVRLLTAAAGRWLGPTAAALVRWSSGAVAAVADHAGASTLELPLRASAHPGMLVPHLHHVAVLAIDIRGFSRLTHALHDTQYLADLIGAYLTEMTEVVEDQRGVVFQYTGDGLLALFLPELAGTDSGPMFARIAHQTGRELHARFDALAGRWRSEWRREGREIPAIGLGVGVSFGRATIGLLGPSGKKQFGAIGEPVNQAAYLCSQAPAGTVVVDRDAFRRAGAPLPPDRIVRLRSKKRHQRIDTVWLRYGARTRPSRR